MNRLTIGVPFLIKDNIPRQMKFARYCLSSIRKYVHCAYNLVIIDNGCAPEGTAFLKEYKPDYFVQFPENTGIANAYNTIVRVSNTSYYYLPMSDNILSDRSTDNQLAFMESNPEYDMIGVPESPYVWQDLEWKRTKGNFNNLFDPHGDESFDLEAWNAAAQRFIDKHLANPNALITPDFCGYNMFFRKETMEKIGYYKINVSRPEHAWNACDVILLDDLRNNDIKYGIYLGGLIYHPFNGMVTSKYVPPQIEPQRLNYLKRLGVPTR